jgi:hypothetical protein
MGWIRKMLRPQNRGEKTKSPATQSASSAGIAGDNPIQRVEDDRLGRASVASSFAKHVLALDAKEGLVVGVLGPWGSGKTSFINLARCEFMNADVPVLDFNPWMFSGVQQLVEAFFVELAAQLRISPGLAAVGEDLQQYGEALSGISWLPVVGPWIARGRDLSKVVGQILQRRKEGVGGRRAKVQKALRGLAKPVIVVVDDIDRLSTSEIRDVFKLVRLTASFPNIIYLVAFDRARVETALAEQGVPGRDYLEKILQVAMDLPAIPDRVLVGQIFSEMDRALDAIDNLGQLDGQLWPDVFMEIIKPMIKNMRDVRRYAAAIHGCARALPGQIALSDVLALEAIRVFLPDVFALVSTSVDALTTTSGSLTESREHSAELKVRIESMISKAGAHGDAIRAMVKRLFPAALRHIENNHYGSEWKNQWLRERRVAHEDILRLYLERAAGETLLALSDAERALACMADAGALDKLLRTLDRERLRDVIASLEIYEEQFAPEYVVPGATVLLNLTAEVPDRRQGVFGFGGKLAVTRVTLRLLRSLKDPGVIESAVRQILPLLRSLSSKLDLIAQVGHREGRGHKLISEPAAMDLEKGLRNEARTAAISDLAKETDLLQILLFAKREASSGEPTLRVPDAPELTLRILRGAWGEVTSQSIGSRAVRRSPRLNWGGLVEVYENEETLKKRVESLLAARPAGADDLLELAAKYLGGWRPNNFDD